MPANMAGNLAEAGMVRRIADEFQKMTRGLKPAGGLDHRRAFHVDEFGDAGHFLPICRIYNRPVPGRQAGRCNAV